MSRMKKLQVLLDYSFIFGLKASTKTKYLGQPKTIQASHGAKQCYQEIEAILRDLHLADNSSLEENYPSITRLGPILKNSTDPSLIIYPIGPKSEYEQIMVPYFSRHGTKQFI